MTDRSSIIEARALGAARDRREGRSLQQIATAYHCSRERARQLCLRGEELQREQEMLASNSWFALPSPIRNALQRDGCKPTIEAVLERYSLHELQRVPAMGEKRIAQLQEWLERYGKEPIK
jgi:hypothetical protein